MQAVGVGVGSEIVVVLEIENEADEENTVDDMVGVDGKPETHSTCPTIKSQFSSKLGLNAYSSACEIPNFVQIA